jgi:hypothetical protein
VSQCFDYHKFTWCSVMSVDVSCAGCFALIVLACSLWFGDRLKSLKNHISLEE